MTLISDIAAKLVAVGYGTAIGTDIFPFLFPPSPLKCICIFPLGGRIPDEVQGDTGIDYPGFQIQVRDIDLEQAASDAEAIRLALNDTTAGNYTMFTTRSQAIDVTSPDDLQATNGPLWRFSVDFETILVR